MKRVRWGKVRWTRGEHKHTDIFACICLKYTFILKGRINQKTKNQKTKVTYKGEENTRKGKEESLSSLNR